MKISELIPKPWFSSEFGGIEKILDQMPVEWLNKDVTPDTLSGLVCLLLDVTELDVKQTIQEAITYPSGRTLVLYTPSLKILSNMFVWACWVSSCQVDTIVKKAEDQS